MLKDVSAGKQDVRDALDGVELEAFRWGEHDAVQHVTPAHSSAGYTLGYGHGLLRLAERGAGEIGPGVVLYAADNVLLAIKSDNQEDLVLRIHLLTMSLRLTVLALKILEAHEPDRG